MAKKKGKAPKKAKKRAGKAVGKATKKAKKAVKKPAKKPVKKAAKKAPPRASNATAARRPRKGLPRPAVAADTRSGGSPAGEAYGEEGWREEELSAAELDADVPELDELEADLDSPEAIGDGEDEAQW